MPDLFLFCQFQFQSSCKSAGTWLWHGTAATCAVARKGGRCQGEKHLTVVPQCLKPGALKSSEHQVSNTLVNLGGFFMYYMCLRDHGSPSRKGEGGGQGKNKKMVAEVANPAWQ